MNLIKVFSLSSDETLICDLNVSRIQCLLTERKWCIPSERCFRYSILEENDIDKLIKGCCDPLTLFSEVKLCLCRSTHLFCVNTITIRVTVLLDIRKVYGDCSFNSCY